MMRFLQKLTNHPAWYAFWIGYTATFLVINIAADHTVRSGLWGFLFGLWVAFSIDKLQEWQLRRMIDREIRTIADDITKRYIRDRLYNESNNTNNNQETSK